MGTVLALHMTDWLNPHYHIWPPKHHQELPLSIEPSVSLEYCCDSLQNKAKYPKRSRSSLWTCTLLWNGRWKVKKNLVAEVERNWRK